MSYIEDNEAINDYMKRTPANTEQAKQIQNQFFSFWQKGSWWDKNMSDDWYDEARTRRNQFNLANAVTPAQKQQVQTVLATGLTREQLRGQTRPEINTQTGAVGTQNKAPTTQKGVGELKRLLKKGVQGDDVKAWQGFLGLTPATGYFDSITDVKTRAYQSEKGLKVDGIVGPKTWTEAFKNNREPSPEVTKDVTVSPTTAAAINASSQMSRPKPQVKAPDIREAANQAADIVASSKPNTSGGKKKKPSGKTPAAEQPTTTVPTVAKAGMLSGLGDFSKLPTWAKVLTGVGTVGAIVAVQKYNHK